jgi:hypothetical protein
MFDRAMRHADGSGSALANEHQPDTQERSDCQKLEKFFANHAGLMFIRGKATSGTLVNSGIKITLPVLRFPNSLKSQEGQFLPGAIQRNYPIQSFGHIGDSNERIKRILSMFPVHGSSELQ